LNPKASGLCYDDKSVVLEFAKPPRDLIMMRPEFLGSGALGQKNAAIVVLVGKVPTL
jgi:hypothetical protein